MDARSAALEDICTTLCQEMLEVQYEIGKFMFIDSTVAYGATPEEDLLKAMHSTRGTEILRRVLLFRTRIEQLFTVASRMGVVIEPARIVDPLNFLIQESQRVETRLRSTTSLQMLYRNPFLHGYVSPPIGHPSV